MVTTVYTFPYFFCIITWLSFLFLKISSFPLKIKVQREFKGRIILKPPSVNNDL
jgi:hypothetical protein